MTHTNGANAESRPVRGELPDRAQVATGGDTGADTGHAPASRIPASLSHIARMFRRLAAELEELGQDLEIRVAAGRVQRDMDEDVTIEEESKPAPLMTVDDLAELCQVDKRTVRRWREEKRLPEAIELGGVIRWHADVVDAWLRGGGK